MKRDALAGQKRDSGVELVRVVKINYRHSLTVSEISLSSHSGAGCEASLMYIMRDFCADTRAATKLRR